MFYPASRFPYIVLWERGYFEVYNRGSLEVVEDESGPIPY